MIKNSLGRSEWQIPIPPLIDCIGLVPNSMCWPHMNRLFSLEWSRQLLPEGHHIIGIDEQTAGVRNGEDDWQVLGEGSVLVATHQRERLFPSGSRIDF